jgi:hypothetical protein
VDGVRDAADDQAQYGEKRAEEDVDAKVEADGDAAGRAGVAGGDGILAHRAGQDEAVEAEQQKDREEAFHIQSIAQLGGRSLPLHLRK